MGLGAVALTSSPSFPTYPNPLTSAQVGGGFSAPATAIALMGKNGAALMLLLLFMAITSAASAELIAVSSLWTFDVYKLYINPSASSSQLVTQSHYGIVVYSLTLAAFCCGMISSGLDITWLITAGGVLVGGGGIDERAGVGGGHLEQDALVELAHRAAVERALKARRRVAPGNGVHAERRAFAEHVGELLVRLGLFLFFAAAKSAKAIL